MVAMFQLLILQVLSMTILLNSMMHLCYIRATLNQFGFIVSHLLQFALNYN